MFNAEQSFPSHLAISMSDYNVVRQVVGLLEVNIINPDVAAESNDGPTTQESASLSEAEKTVKERVYAAYLLLQSGSIEEAVASLRELVDAQDPVLDIHHRQMAVARDMLAAGLYGIGPIDEAREQYEKVAEIRTVSLGPEDVLTLHSKCNVGIVLWVLDQREEACQLLDETYRIQERVNSLHHRGTISTMQNLAFMLHFSERSWEAQKLQKRVVDAQLEYRLPGDPDLLKSAILLGAIYSDMEWWKEAEPIYRLVVDSRIALQGLESPATIASTANLIRAIQGQGRLDEAEQLCRDIVERSSRVSGPEAPPTLRNKFSLSTIFRDKGDYDAALHLQEEILSVEKTVYREEDGDSLTTMRGIAATLRQAGKRDELENQLKDLISIGEKAHGPSRLAVLHDKLDLAALYCERSSWDTALEVIDGVVVDSDQSSAQDNDNLYERLREISFILLQHGKLSVWSSLSNSREPLA